MDAVFNNTASRDDRVRQIIEDPERYFGEARTKATRNVQEEMERERLIRAGAKKPTSRP